MKTCFGDLEKFLFSEKYEALKLYVRDLGYKSFQFKAVTSFLDAILAYELIDALKQENLSI